MAEAALAQTAPTSDLASEEARRLALSRQRTLQIRNADAARTRIPAGGQVGSTAVDQAIGRQSREQSMASRLQRERNASGAQEGEGGGLSVRDVASMAKMAKNATPAGMAAQQFLVGSGPGGLPASGEDAKRMIGNALVKMSWSNLWMTFGHSVYVLDVLFFAGWASTYLRKYIPEVGTEWIPPDILKKTSKHLLLPLKLGEIVALSFITFWVLCIDLLILGCIGFIVGLVMTIKNAL